MAAFQFPWRSLPEGRVFISYRRDDAKWVAGRLADSLIAYFGRGRIFRDIEHISGGADFGQEIDQTIKGADAIIVLIGPSWLSEADANGLRRLDDPNDWVAREVVSALDSGTAVYPVLIGDTPMPRPDELPERLKQLSRFNAMTIDDDRWDGDVQRIAKVIGLDIPSQLERKLNGLNLLVSVSLCGSVVLTTSLLVWNLIGRVSAANPLPDWLPARPKQFDSLADADAIWPLSLAQAGISFVVIAWCSVALFVHARAVSESKRRFFYAAAWTGGIGSLLFFVLIKPVDDAFEPLLLYFGSTIIASVMFAFISLSGFRPR